MGLARGCSNVLATLQLTFSRVSHPRARPRWKIQYLCILFPEVTHRHFRHVLLDTKAYTDTVEETPKQGHDYKRGAGGITGGHLRDWQDLDFSLGRHSAYLYSWPPYDINPLIKLLPEVFKVFG